MGGGMLKDPKTYKALLAEFLGTLLLVVIGCGSGTNWGGKDGAPTVTEISLAVGFALASIIQSIGHISGGHINPSVTISMVVTRKMSPFKATLYIIVQCAGAIAGSALLMQWLPESVRGTLGATVPNSSITPIQAATIECFLTFVFVMTIHSVCDDRRVDVRGSAPLAIGLAATAICITGIRLTGCSLNPARSLGPAVMASVWTHHWVYWAGPCVGGALGGLVYQIFFRSGYEPCAN